MRLREVSGLQLKVSVAGYREIEVTLDQRVAKDAPSDHELRAQSVREGTHPGEVIFDLAAIAREAKAMEEPHAPAASGEAPPPPLLSEEERLQALQKTVKQSSKALLAALDLCVEKGLFSLEDIATAMKRGN
jgi:hypothetical protein